MQSHKPINSTIMQKPTPTEVEDNLYQNATAMGLDRAFQFALSGKAKGDITMENILKDAEAIKNYLVNYKPKNLIKIA